MNQFACHSTGTETPAICAGYLLRGAEHNIAARLDLMSGRTNMDKVHDDGHELFDDYVEMAVANGVSPDDPVLQPCRRSSFALSREEIE